jgi:4-amino-4-deoxy-L-arabinose transferase-like glycosyltransferase
MKSQYIFLIFILLLGLFLSSYRINTLMPFIGDQGWFYLATRDMLLTGNIPLVGITSSHVWLHQGPFWTYMLALPLWLSHFNPVSGAYLTIGFGIVTVFMVYFVGKSMFSERIGLMSALIYATSPLLVFYTRYPYHTSVMPLLTLLLFFALFKWVRGYKYGFPLVIFLYAVLYNFEIATIVLLPPLFLLLGYGLSLIAYIFPMLPMLLYDLHHGFPQTFKVIIWVGYKIATHFGYPPIHEVTGGETYTTMWLFGTGLVQKIVFLQNAWIAWLILFLAFLNLCGAVYKKILKKQYIDSHVLLSLFFIIPVIGYVAAKTNSEAYLSLLFPTIAFMIALFFDRLMRIRFALFPSFFLLFLFIGCNIFALFTHDFLMHGYGYGPTIQERTITAQKIVQEAHQKKYNIVGKGDWSQFPSFIMNYEYLTWWLGNPPTKKKQQLRFDIREVGGYEQLVVERRKL